MRSPSQHPRTTVTRLHRCGLGGLTPSARLTGWFSGFPGKLSVPTYHAFGIIYNSSDRRYRRIPQIVSMLCFPAEFVVDQTVRAPTAKTLNSQALLSSALHEAQEWVQIPKSRNPRPKPESCWQSFLTPA